MSPGDNCPKCRNLLVVSAYADELALCMACGFTAYKPFVDPVIPAWMRTNTKGSPYNAGKITARVAARRKRVAAMRASGIKVKDIARRCGVNETTIAKDCRELGITAKYTGRSSSADEVAERHKRIPEMAASGLSYAEIGAALGISAGLVGWYNRRNRQQRRLTDDNA